MSRIPVIIAKKKVNRILKSHKPDRTVLKQEAQEYREVLKERQMQGKL